MNWSGEVHTHSAGDGLQGKDFSIHSLPTCSLQRLRAGLRIPGTQPTCSAHTLGSLLLSLPYSHLARCTQSSLINPGVTGQLQGLHHRKPEGPEIILRALHEPAQGTHDAPEG